MPHRDVLRRNNVVVRGEGPRTLVFAHGFGCSQQMWRHVEPAFRARWRTVCLDYVGAGGSDLGAYDARRYATLSGYAHDVLEVCEALRLERPVFIGHSVSGIIGMLASIESPAQFDGIVGVASSPCYLEDPPDYHGGLEAGEIDGLLELMDRNHLGWASFLAAAVLQNPDLGDVEQELRRSFCAIEPSIASGFARATFHADHRADLTRVPVPVLLLQSAADTIAPPSVGAYMAARLPRATLHELPIVGHCPHLSHPALTIAAIEAWLGRRERAA